MNIWLRRRPKRGLREFVKIESTNQDPLSKD